MSATRPARDIHLVTGAFGYSGQYIARRLLERGLSVRTITDSPERANPFGGRIEVRPFHFGDFSELRKSFEGVSVFYNTYWVRFNHGSFRHSAAVENTRLLFRAAREAGVRRVVHISIANPSRDSDLEYFAGKWALENALRESGLPHSILRPTVLFGGEDILINNIAWLLRRFPVFAVFGRGDYRLQPVHVDDLAAIAVEEGGKKEDAVIDAAGPEVFTYRGLARTLGEILGRPRPIVSLPASIGAAAGWLLGKALRDVVITPEEIEGLMRSLLVVSSAPTGKTRLTDWARRNASTLGRRYASELARRRDRRSAYGSL